MSLRSTVAVQHLDGTVSQAIGYHDGQVELLGIMLFTRFKTIEQIEETFIEKEGNYTITKFNSFDEYKSLLKIEKINYIFTEHDDSDGNRADMWLIWHEGENEIIPLKNLLSESLISDFEKRA